MSSGRIAIIGAGPIGLEAALYARELGHEVLLLERDHVPAANVSRWGFVRLFSPWQMNTTALGRAHVPGGAEFGASLAQICPTAAEWRERYLLPLSRCRQLQGAIHTDATVLGISRDDYGKSHEIGTGNRRSSKFRILVRNSSGREWVEHSDIVLDCSGTYHHHRWAGRGGIPAPGERAAASRIAYHLPDIAGADRDRYADRHILLLGCGYSSATALAHLAELHRAHPNTRVSWAFRRHGQAVQSLQNDPLEVRRALVERSVQLAEKPPEWLQFLGPCVLESVELGDPLAATLDWRGTTMSILVDQVIALVGYSPDTSIYEQLQVHQCYATGGPMKLAAALLGSSSTDCLTVGSTLSAESLLNPEPDFYILGAKSYGTNSNFLLQIGHNQVRDVFRLISSDKDLDLHQSAAHQVDVSNAAAPVVAGAGPH